MKSHGLLLVLAALLLTLPILGPWTLGGHDLLYYFMYAQQTAANMRDGVWLPAWAPDLNYGFGGPALLFYPPLVNITHALSLLAGIPLWTGMGLLTCAAALLSGGTALLWLRQVAEPRAAWAGAMVYMIAPYRVIDIYERTALAEHWSFIFPPLILWAIGSRRIAVIAFATAALLMTNLPLAVLFGLTIAAYAIVHRAFVVPLVGGLLGFAMAAMTLIPQALASRWLRIELWFGAAGRYRPSANTIFSSIGDDPEFNTRVSWVVLATAALVVIAALAARAKFWWIVSFVAFVATLPFAGAAWDVLPLLSRLQFPWRAASVLTLAAAALTAHVASPRIRLALVILAAAAAIPFYGRSILRQDLFANPLPPAMAARLFPDPRAVLETGGAYGNTTHQRLIDVWFLPRTANPAFIDELLQPQPRLGRLRDAPAFLSSDAPVRVVRWGRLERTIAIDVPRPGVLIWHSLFFPTMELVVDGRPTPALPHESTGLASLSLTPGRHEVTWRWRPFRELMVGRWISVAAFLVTVLIGVWKARQR